MGARVDSVASVKTGKGALDLELSVPASSKPSAIVVIVPGSGGFSDPYFDSEILRPSYSYANRGGITDALISAGYAVAAYSVRGFRGTSCLPPNIAPADRASYFVKNCIDQEVRSGVALREISEDTRNIFAYLRNLHQFSGIPQVALAFSEGMYHVSDVYDHEMGQKLVGIVSVGGPYDSMHEVAKYQSTHAAYFKMIDAAFADDSVVRASSDVIAKVNGKDANFKLAGLVETMGGDTIDRSQVAARKSYWNEFYRQGYEIFTQPSLKGTMGATLDGAKIEKGWALRYYSQFLSDDRKPSVMLERFKGVVSYLYGSDDVVVRIPSHPEFVESEKSAAGPRSLEIIEHADHGLSAEGMPTAQALEKILSSIAAALASQRDLAQH